MVGVTANAVLRWEKAEVTPTRDKMMELAATFQVEPGWLAWGICTVVEPSNAYIMYEPI